MAGTIIADKIQTENSFLTLNVGASNIATMNSSGIYSPTGVKMIGSDGTIGASTIANTAITGFINGSQLAANTVANSNIQTGAIENYLNSQNLNLGMRNRVINGAMQVWQRATSSSTNGYTTVDRFSVYADSSTSVSRSTDTATGFQYSASLTGTGSTGFTHKIEAANIADLASQTVTLSFWLKQSTGAGAGAIGAYIYSADAADDFSGNTLITSQTFTTTSSWAKYSVTFALSSAAANGIQITIRTTSASSVTFLLTGVQLEKGSQATPFEYRQIGTELQLCQRYCQKLMPAIQLCKMRELDRSRTGSYTFPVQMRTTATVGAMSTTDSISVTISEQSDRGFSMYCLVSGDGYGAQINTQALVTAEL